MRQREDIGYNFKLNAFLTIFLGLLLLIGLLSASFLSFAIDDILEKKIDSNEAAGGK